MLEIMFRLIWMLFVLFICVSLAGWYMGFGPVIWLRRARGVAQAQADDSVRRELVERVRQVLPQANNANTVFSLWEENRGSGGSKVHVVSTAYHYMVYVADSDCLWAIPFHYDKRAKTYQLGSPAALTKDRIQNVSLDGKRDKNLKVTFYLKKEVGYDTIVMALAPVQFKKNRFYPFNLLQEEACARALSAAEKLAFAACGKTPEDLEKDRIKGECLGYAIYAIVAGFVGFVVASGSGSLVGTLVFFAAALGLFGLMIAKKNPPKFSVIAVVLEALLSYMFLR